MSSTTSAKQVAVRSLEILPTGNRAHFDAVIHPVAHREGTLEAPAARLPGPHGFYSAALFLRAAVSGLRHEILHVVADGDIVCLETMMTGRRVGTLTLHTPAGEVDRTIPADGTRFRVAQTHWMRIDNGMIVRHWGFHGCLAGIGHSGLLSTAAAAIQ
ncbi:ester cyclase [Nocardia jejuensis]|uniref:ester cyclase n=1 Tax=Nocardia jejuensis TaxID=328049 RepID=UPI00082D357D|nr:ester cyclase [Nocardia jejuensis]